MKTRKHDTRWMVGTAMMAAIVVLLANTPLGLIPLPIIKATTTHIPVILGAILLGPLAGGILGGVFGICSMVNNTIAPAVLSFAFSPFLALSLPGALKAVWVSVGCRVMIGVVSGWLWLALRRLHIHEALALPVVGFVGSMTNTVCVMGSIYLLLRPEYAQAMGVAADAVLGLVLGVITGSSVLEALVALVLVTAIGLVLLRVPYLRPVQTAGADK
ncbi:MAG: ECF transporter S component [Lawsonibacter sp.]|nr:ECF transporter S component [Lawsonibacter sp.]